MSSELPSPCRRPFSPPVPSGGPERSRSVGRRPRTPDRRRAGGRPGASPGSPLPSLAAAALAAAVVAGPALPGTGVAQEAGGVPTPASVIGWEPGADYKIADYGQILGYFRALDEASDRLLLEEIGETAEGRTMVLAVISSEENLGRLDGLREISRRLAMGEAADSAEARRLAEEGRAVVWIDGGLHATEVAGAQFTPKFAHRIVTEESDEVRRIRDRTILLLMPVMNPDGLEIVSAWYRRNLGTPYERTGPPELYQKYVGHDNNRDWFMIQQPETRAVARQLWHVWYPQIVLNHHQTAPFPARIFIPPFADPVNPHIPPLVVTGNNLVGVAMHRRFVREGKPGAVSRVGFTQWWNGGMRTAPYFHNQVGILTEVAHNSPTPRDYDPERLPRSFGNGLSAERPSTWYPMPWEGGHWGLGDAVDYMVTASMAAAEIGAELKEDWLFNTWRMAREAIETRREDDPAAYVVSLEDQRDGGEAVEMLEVLRRGGVRVERATEAFTAGDARYPAGTFLIPAAQPYRPYLRDLLEPQDYPDRRQYPGGPPDVPYDLAGWTLPLQMGVRVDRVAEAPRVATAPVEGVEVRTARGGVRGDGEAFLLSPTGNMAFRAVNALLEAGGIPISRAREPFEAGGREWPAGTFVVRADPERLGPVAEEHAQVFVGVDDVPAGTASLSRPRIGLYRSWIPNMDEGWTRWILEGYGFGYERLTNEDLRSGDLSGFDAIILPDQSPESILHGWPEGRMPEEYTGGIGLEGALALRRFAEGGGLLLTFDEASQLPIEAFGLPLRNPVARAEPTRFFIPGSLIRLRVDPSDPVAWGMDEEAAAFFVRSRAFRVTARPPEEVGEGEEETAPGPRVDVIARYASDELLLSGWEIGADRYLGDAPAVARVPMGEGHVVLIGFRPQFRAQPRATFKLVFNALYAATMEGLPMESLGPE